MAKRTQPRKAEAQYLVSRSELSRVFGVSLPTIDNWRRHGLPQVEVDGGAPKSGRRKYQYNVPDCIEWYLHRHLDDLRDDDEDDGAPAGKGSRQKLDEARYRKTVAQAEQAEIETRIRRGELVEVEDVRSVWSQHVLNVRNRILSVADSAAPRLAKMKRTQPIRDDLKRRLEHALEQLSEAESEEVADGGGGGED